jgi:hypothetical protein
MPPFKRQRRSRCLAAVFFLQHSEFNYELLPHDVERASSMAEREARNDRSMISLSAECGRQHVEEF